MKKLYAGFITLAILIMPIEGIAVETSSATGQKITTQEKQELRNQVNQKFNDFRSARTQAMLFACAHHLAQYQTVTLKEDFYAQENASMIALNNAQMSLNQILTLVKSRMGGDEGKTIDDFFQFEAKNSAIDFSIVTRGLCQNYKKDFAEDIQNTLKHYQTVSLSKDKILSQKNAIYLNSHFQLTHMTTDVGKQEVPDTLWIDSKSYPIHCTYENVQNYDQAISTDTPLRDIAYQASKYFYLRYTPQINYILSCQAETNLNRGEISSQISDTYPWYRPIATGSKNEIAAGDALSYVDKDQVILVLGHEPCACNHQSAKDCGQLKETTRGFKERLWKVIAALEEGIDQYPLKVQQDIQAFTSFARTEMEKDFCFIDRDEIRSRMADMLTAVKKDMPQGLTLSQDSNQSSQ